VFERATWAYLRESENLIYRPSDESQQRKVNELVTERKRRMSELVTAIREAIDEAASENDRYIAELTFERDQIESKLARIKRDLAFARIAMGSDPAAKERKREELQQEREAALAQIDELSKLIPAEG
jgi:hypothetical protein